MRKAQALLTALMFFVAIPSWGQATANGTANASAGNAQADNAGNNQLLQLNSTSAAPLPMTTTGSMLLSPNIFGPLGNTPGSASVPFTAAANRLCSVRYSRAYLPNTKAVEDTNSGQTRLVFNSYPSAQWKAGSAVEVNEMDPPDLTARVYNNAICLGTITVLTKESAGNSTDFSVVQADAMRFLFEEIKGYRRLALVSLIQSVSAASGVSTDSSSFGLGGLLGHIVSLTTTAGFGPTFSKGGGKTNPTNFPGGTFLVLAIDEPDGQTLDTAQLGQFFVSQSARSDVGGNGKKLQAVQ
jgi:hypothetical protein